MTDFSHPYVWDKTKSDYRCACGRDRDSVWHTDLDRGSDLRKLNGTGRGFNIEAVSAE